MYLFKRMHSNCGTVISWLLCVDLPPLVHQHTGNAIPVNGNFGCHNFNCPSHLVLSLNANLRPQVRNLRFLVYGIMGRFCLVAGRPHWEYSNSRIAECAPTAEEFYTELYSQRFLAEDFIKNETEKNILQSDKLVSTVNFDGHYSHTAATNVSISKPSMFSDEVDSVLCEPSISTLDKENVEGISMLEQETTPTITAEIVPMSVEHHTSGSFVSTELEKEYIAAAAAAEHVSAHRGIIATALHTEIFV